MPPASTDRRSRFRLGHAVRTSPPVVWALVATQACVLLAYSLLVPVYRAPDEPQHVDAVLVVAGGEGWPPPGELTMDERVMASLPLAQFNERPRLAADAVPDSARPSLDELAPDAPSSEPNQMTQHPPLYYALGAGLLTVVDAVADPVESWPYDDVTQLLRMLSVALIAPLPLLAFWASRRLGMHAAALAAAAVPLSVPMLAHIGSTVNNDNLLTLLFGFMTVLLTFVATGDTSWQTALKVGVVAVLALLTKGFALVLPAWVAAAYALAALRRRSWRPLRPLALAGAVLAIGGGWWWLRNLLAYGRVQPIGRPGAPPAPESFVAAPGDWAIPYARRMIRRFWGDFGWVEIQLPWDVVWVAAGALAVGIAAAFVVRRRGTPWTRADVALLLVPLLTIGAIVTVQSWRSYARNGMFGGVQGRYLFPALPGMAVAAAAGYASLVRRATRWLPLVVLLAAGLLHLYAGRVLLLYFWGPRGLFSEPTSLDALLAWSPWPAALVLGAFVAASLAGLASAALLLTTARRHEPSPTPRPRPRPADAPVVSQRRR